MTLTKNQKQAWLSALRSGVYTKNQSQLKNTEMENCYCVLGILAICVGLRIDNQGWVIVSNGLDKGYQPLRELIGKSNVDILFHKNDDDDETFEVMADWIDKNILV